MVLRVAVLLPSQTETFELGVACEVFGVDRRDDGLPLYHLDLVAAEPGPVATRYGYSIPAEHDLDLLDRAGLIIVNAGGNGLNPDGSTCVSEDPGSLGPALDALRRAAHRGTPVASLCTGAFILGAAGLLDGRRCTTRWRHAAELQRRFPSARVDPTVLYVEDPPVFTSAGTAASIDLCLHLVRQLEGPRVANGIARRMVVPPHREGGQAQFVNQPLPAGTGDSLAEVREWMCAHLAEEHSVAALARRARMSPRTFARRFVDETGVPPHRWLTDQRVLAAQHLLESSPHSIERIASLVGFSSAAALRAHFLRLRQVTPLEYRRMFAAPKNAAPRDPASRDGARELVAPGPSGAGS
ncbi:GlxA family transcriptional regulator [Lolliginicoccus levis]|uniref:GlxA family transcriptional regulator n=1 Tax=Lolliginicoccus levis TaxID=2919542 RepID=UPI00241FAF3A|nr:helix-turn-helix domain-containing protein [Lolliginicoccus levis]